jgi:hypothetical protein
MNILENIDNLIVEIERHNAPEYIEEKITMRGMAKKLAGLFRRSKPAIVANMSDDQIKQRNGLVFRLKMRTAKEFNRPPAQSGQERYGNGTAMIGLMRKILTGHNF